MGQPTATRAPATVSGPASDRTRVGCALAAATIGALTLTGWLTGRREFAGIHPDYIPMAPNTAIGFLALAATLLAGSRARGGGSGWKVVAAGAAGAIACLSLLRLLELTARVDLGVDAWFFHIPTERFGLVPVGKMALSTALAFFAASVAALLWLGDLGRRAADATGLLGLAVAATGLVFCLGYIHAAPLLYGGAMIPMALNTAVAFLLTGTALVAAAGPGALPMRRMAGPTVGARLRRSFLPFTFGVVLLASWLTLLVVRVTAPSWAAIVTAGVVSVAIALAGALCAAIAGRIAERIEAVEAELRRAHDELEHKVEVRTRDLRHAKDLLEQRNRQLQESADELARTADSVRRAHQELQRAHDDLKRAEAQIVQSEKISSLCQMVAGVAHEINNPLAYVSNNVAVLRRDVADLNAMIRLYQQAEGTLELHQRELLARIHELAEAIDITYVMDNLPGLMARSSEGLKRIQKIVEDLRNFARLDRAEFQEVNLNVGIEATLHLLRGLAQGRGVALETDFDPLPPVTCFPAKVNQLVLNLVSNAIDACDPGGTVTIRTRGEADGVALIVEDTGHGIEPAIVGKIFDPFFTTKPVGQGAGLGLSISYGIVQAHGGRIEVESEPGRGTRFTAHLPYDLPKAATAAARALGA